MKKFILCILCLLICSIGAAAAPAKKVVLWYQVPDVILEAQNPENDTEKGQKELEAFIQEQYGKRFAIQSLKRAPQKELTVEDVSLITRPAWIPVIVKIDLAGAGTGEKLVGKYATVKVSLQESVVADGQIFTYDYGIKEYDSSMLRVAGYVVASEDDPRINTKNAVNDCLTEACTLNTKVNRYADPAAYEKENARYNGEFQNIK
ncbi:hypothetical protein [uncultured Phascolarctobacterium sp.]|uniref:hypothetical protein n=1 Tax=uncultured Phascolarctobacterium sp. TaxID=512296 RepID=UPI0025E857D3|nr:hypothetical protein [uncultured Phascolarctobacterium sp.]